jgi:hypothetical protein
VQKRKKHNPKLALPSITNNERSLLYKDDMRW